MGWPGSARALTWRIHGNAANWRVGWRARRRLTLGAAENRESARLEREKDSEHRMASSDWEPSHPAWGLPNSQLRIDRSHVQRAASRALRKEAGRRLFGQ